MDKKVHKVYSFKKVAGITKSELLIKIYEEGEASIACPSEERASLVGKLIDQTPGLHSKVDGCSVIATTKDKPLEDKEQTEDKANG